MAVSVEAEKIDVFVDIEFAEVIDRHGGHLKQTFPIFEQGQLIQAPAELAGQFIPDLFEGSFPFRFHVHWSYPGKGAVDADRLHLFRIKINISKSLLQRETFHISQSFVGGLVDELEQEMTGQGNVLEDLRNGPSLVSWSEIQNFLFCVEPFEYFGMRTDQVHLNALQITFKIHPRVVCSIMYQGKDNCL